MASLGKKNPLIAIAFGKPKKDSGSSDAMDDEDTLVDGPDSESEEEDPGLDTACDEIMDAIKLDDREGLCAALKSFVRMAREG